MELLNVSTLLLGVTSLFLAEKWLLTTLGSPTTDKWGRQGQRRNEETCYPCRFKASTSCHVRCRWFSALAVSVVRKSNWIMYYLFPYSKSISSILFHFFPLWFGYVWNFRYTTFASSTTGRMTIQRLAHHISAMILVSLKPKHLFFFYLEILIFLWLSCNTKLRTLLYLLHSRGTPDVQYCMNSKAWMMYLDYLSLYEATLPFLKHVRGYPWITLFSLNFKETLISSNYNLIHLPL